MNPNYFGARPGIEQMSPAQDLKMSIITFREAAYHIIRHCKYINEAQNQCNAWIL